MIRNSILIMLVVFCLPGCSRQDTATPADKEHVWQVQTDALRQAEQLRDRQNAQTSREQQQYDQLDQESRSQ